MKKAKLKLTALICNILICILSLTSIGSYFLLPLWRIDASYTVPEKTIEKLLTELLEESATENEELKNIDISDIVDEEGLTISLSLSLRTQDVFASLGNKGTEIVQTIISDNINSAVDSFSGTLNEMTKGLTKSVTKNTLHYIIEEKLADALPEDEMVKEVEEILADVGIDTEYISQKTDELVELIFAEDATVESLAQDITNVVEEVVDKLASSDNEDLKDLQLKEEDIQFIHSAVTEALSYIADEEGNIIIDDIIAKILLEAINGEFNMEDMPELPEMAAANSVKGLSVSSGAQSDSIDSSTSGDSALDEPSQEEMDAQEELKALLAEKFMSALPDKMVWMMTLELRIICVLLILTFLTWFYLVIKVLVKLGAENNAIKLKLPILLGWEPFLVLYLIPTILVALVKNPPAVLGKLIGAENLAKWKDLTSGLNVSFTTGAWVSFAVAMFLALFTIFFYGGIRKKLKKAIIAEKEFEKQAADVADTEETPAIAETTAEESPVVTETPEATPVVTETPEATPAVEETPIVALSSNPDDEIDALFGDEVTANESETATTQNADVATEEAAKETTEEIVEEAVENSDNEDISNDAE